VNWLAVFDKVSRWVFPLAALWTLAWVWVLPERLPHTVQLLGLALVVLLLGLPHGALDPWLAQSLKWRGRALPRWVFNAVYGLLSVSVVVAWVFFPVLCLGVFLLISAWHFSGDWDANLPWLWRRALGALLLLMPVGFHTQEVAQLFAHLSGEGGAALAHGLALPAWALALGMVFIASAAAAQRRWSLVIELMLLVLLAFAVPPLVYFALYFCLLHSPRHLAHIFRREQPSVHPHLLRTMGVYTFLTLLGLAVMALLYRTAPLDTVLMQVVFIGLAALTVPHMLLIFVLAVQDRQPVGWR
jgi:Brp/Blh family beta-carotene 15,15'-monooxygenase